MRRRLVALPIALALAGVAGAGGAWASHQFTDVADGNFFHESIGNIVSAGCATGFNDGTFRPNTNPTRGQFAFWTSNCGVRVSFDSTTVQLSGGSFVPEPDQPTATIEAGAAAEGGFVVVTTAWTAKPAVVLGAAAPPTGGPDIQFAGSIPCPCNVETKVVGYFDSTFANPEFAYSSDSWNSQDGGDLRRMSGAGQHVLKLAAGDTVALKMFGIYTNSESGADDIDLEMQITAMYVPFGWDGGPDLRPTVTS